MNQLNNEKNIQIIKGLCSDTSHLVIVTAQIPNHTTESSIGSSNYAASIEFRTLASKSLAIPQNLILEKDMHEAETFVLSWFPVCTSINTASNGIPVGGYSIYLDGIRVHQILNPTAANVNLTSKLLFNNGAKLLTLRTLSLDANVESKDSEPIELSNILNSLTQVNNNLINNNNNNEMEEKKFKQIVPQQQVPAPAAASTTFNANRQINSAIPINQNNEAIKKAPTNITSINQNQFNQTNDDNNRVNPVMTQKPTPVINKPQIQQQQQHAQPKVDLSNPQADLYQSNSQNQPVMAPQVKKNPNAVPKPQIPLSSY